MFIYKAIFVVDLHFFCLCCILYTTCLKGIARWKIPPISWKENSTKRFYHPIYETMLRLLYKDDSCVVLFRDQLMHLSNVWFHVYAQWNEMWYPVFTKHLLVFLLLIISLMMLSFLVNFLYIHQHLATMPKGAVHILDKIAQGRIQTLPTWNTPWTP